MNNILERFRDIAENEGITITRLEHKIGASKGVLSRALANSSDIQSKWLSKLVENYPQYSCDWLIKGIEPMIREEKLNVNVSENSDISEVTYKILADERKQTIDNLQKIINLLEEKIAKDYK